MRNYKMVFSYDGSRYKGWQKLGMGELTIQGILENVIGKLLSYPVEIHGSGRTDAGVHAHGQTVSMKIPFSLEESFKQDLNQRLPEDIRLQQIEQMSGSFHARYCARGKTYRYVIDTNEKPDVFTRKYVYHFPQEVNVGAMKEAAQYLIGTHDFSSFTDDRLVGKVKVRTIYEITLCESNGRIEVVYHGDGFMQHMVRILTGTLLEVGIGKRRPEEIMWVLEQKERAKAGFMVPAKGLFLENVDYEEQNR